MKIAVDNKVVLELNKTRCKVICNDIPSDVFVADMERRVEYIIQHKYKKCFKRLKDEWEPRLKSAGVQSIPLDEDAFAELVFAQPDYKCRKKREDEAAAKELL